MAKSPPIELPPRMMSRDELIIEMARQMVQRDMLEMEEQTPRIKEGIEYTAGRLKKLEDEFNRQPPRPRDFSLARKALGINWLRLGVMRCARQDAVRIAQLLIWAIQAGYSAWMASCLDAWHSWRMLAIYANLFAETARKFCGPLRWPSH